MFVRLNMPSIFFRRPILIVALMVAFVAAVPARADSSHVVNSSRVVVKQSKQAAATKPLFLEDTTSEYFRRSGADIPFALDGALPPGAYVAVRAWHNDQRRMVAEFRHYLRSQPLRITAAQLDNIPPGNVLLHLFLFLPGQHKPVDASHWLSVRDDAPPEPILGKRATRPAFPKNAPNSYSLGSGVGIRFELDGALPHDAHVAVQAWHNDQRRMVTEFHHQIRSKPLRITAAQLDKIPPGNVLLHLFLFLPGQHKPVDASHWITIQPKAKGSQLSDQRVGARDASVPLARASIAPDAISGSGAADTDEHPNPWNDTRSLASGPHSFLAVNVERANYWSRGWMFTDVMNQATWHYGAYRVFVDSDGHFPQGSYTVVPENAAQVVITNHVEIRPNPGFSNGDFSVYLPGFGPGELGEGRMFHPLFLDRLGPFKTLRFMLMQRTNDGQADRWEQRPRPNPRRSRRYGDAEGSEVPIEHMVEMCNAAGANPWFCMPHKADETYVRNFARLVKQRLNPGANVYVEYSNEVWNFVFIQAQWLNQDVRGPNGPGINHDLWAEKIQWVRRLWREEFGSQADRVVMVLAAQEANPWHTERLIERLTRDSERHFDAISTSAYFGSSDATIAAAMRDLTQRHPNRVQHGLLARQHDVPYISYEAGQHLLPSDGAPHSIQETPEMYDAILENMRSFELAGGSMYNAFELMGPQSNAGYWGHLRYMDQPVDEALKYKAVIDYLNSAGRLQLSSFD